MPPEIIAGGLGAVASIGGAILGGNAQKKAAGQAVAVSQENTDANNQLSREMYSNNAARLDPFSANGLLASNALTDMLLGTRTFSPTANPYTHNLLTQTSPPGTMPGTIPGVPLTGVSSAPYTAAQIAAMMHDGIPHNSVSAQAANDAWYSSHPTGGAAPVGGALAPYAPPPANPAIQQQAQAAIAAGADPHAVQARMSQLSSSSALSRYS